MSEDSSTSDRHSPSRRSSQISASSRSPSRRRASISHSSPPSTPSSFDAEFPDVKAQHRPPSLNLSSLGPIQVKNEHHTPHSTLFDAPSLPAVPELHMEQQLMVNRVASLCLWADGMETKYVDFEAMPFELNPDGSPQSPLPNGIVRTSLRMKLQMPADGYSSNAVGFNGALSFVTLLPPSAELMTRVHVDNICISREVAPLVCMDRNANQAGQELVVAMLPDSWLTRCRWLDTGNKKAIVTQQVILDAEIIFVVVYDLQRVHGALPSAEIAHLRKHVDNAPPQAPALLPLPMSPPSASRFGSNVANSYLYSTAASIAGGHAQAMQQHQHQQQPQHPQSPHAQQPPHTHGHMRTHSLGAGHPPALPSPGAYAMGSAGAVKVDENGHGMPSQSNQTTPTHTSFPQLASSPPLSASSATSGGPPSSSGSATGRSSCVGYGQGGMGVGMVAGVGMMGHNNSLGFNSDPWTTSLLPLF